MHEVDFLVKVQTEPLISVVIPTLNEAEGVERALQSVRRQAPAHEIIVADGGSRDETTAIAGQYAQVVQAPRGRARQMNAGAAQARGDILLFLHADTLLPSGGLERVRSALTDPACSGGAFRLSFDHTSPLLRFYACFSHLPLPLLCFGDRGCFFRRSAFEEAGGYPDVPIFEDLELVRQIHAWGGFVFLEKSVVSSARRFRKRGPLLQQLRNASLWLRYVGGADPHALARLYPYAKS